jgi:ABC-type proline/glycine betaine transport system permease subunit
LKWVITFASIASFTLLNILALYFLQFNKKEMQLFLLVEGVCLILAVLAFILGKITHQNEAVYPAVRGIMGILQSPVLVLIFIPAKKLFNRTF